MNEQQFDICLEFHLGIIRSRPHKQTIDDARNGIKGGTCPKGAAVKFIDALQERFNALISWKSARWIDGKVNIYNAQNTRNPSSGAFTAAFSVINDGAKISKAAIANKVNYQSVKVLIPRLKRWEEYAAKLVKTL